MKMRSVMEHAFSQIPSAEIPRSSFDRSHGHKTTFDAGYLIPIFVDEALPGDTFNLSMTGFARLATPIVPLMDNMFMETFFFAVPYRLLWENFERFMGAQDDPDDSTDFLLPMQENNVTPLDELCAEDYMGIPPGILNIEYSALPIRAYVKIWNEWFRDQNLQDHLVENFDDGPDPGGTGTSLLRRGKRHDYFTSCLPWPQKGDSVSLPLGTTAPVIPEVDGISQPTFFHDATGPGTSRNLITSSSATTVHVSGAQPAASEVLRWLDPNLQVNLSEATAATINQLRQAFQIQKLLERDARGGTRYTEIVRSHFGVVSPDARLQRPEYLGGGSSPVNITPVAQTSETNEAGTPQGNLSAFGTAHLRGHGFTKSFTEHCIVIGLVSVRADISYQQGLNRMWSRQTKYDVYWPALAHIGEQPVFNREIFLQGIGAGTPGLQDQDVFGYQERFAEYRYKPSMVTARMRSSSAASLDVWHLATDFATVPVLGSTFIEDNPPIDRVIAVPSEPHFIFDSYFSLRCARPMPLFGVPGLIDHF